MLPTEGAALVGQPDVEQSYRFLRGRVRAARARVVRLRAELAAAVVRADALREWISTRADSGPGPRRVWRTESMEVGGGNAIR